MKSVSQIVEDVLKKTGVKEKPIGEHVLVYDSLSESLEPLYFFILELAQNFGYDVEKIIDNFTSTPGSSHFAEMGQRATRMQEEGMKIMGSINTVLRSVLNLLYDLKEFRTRLEVYTLYNTTKDKAQKQAALLSLKQVWLDKVDIQKGNTSLKAMAFGQSGFQTLLDAFLIAEDLKAIDKLDLNERVLQILRPRASEFYTWLKYSEDELRKRYSIEKNYLKSQLASLKLYARWARPYLRAAAQLEQKEFSREPSLVKSFNTIRLELTLLGKQKLDIKKLIASGDVPPGFDKLKSVRTYYSCVLLDFVFTGIPQRNQQGQYLSAGKTQVTFRSYALNSDELKLLEKELEKSDLSDSLQLIGNVTGDSLLEIQKDVESFLNEDVEKKDDKKSSEDNPFFALLGFYSKKEEKKIEKPFDEKDIKKEKWGEREYLRKIAAKNAKDSAFDLFNTFKKAHNMASYT